MTVPPSGIGPTITTRHLGTGKTEARAAPAGAALGVVLLIPIQPYALDLELPGSQPYVTALMGLVAVE
jgi:hypothetical protein